MVKVTIRKAGTALVGAALATGIAHCAPAERDEVSAYDNEVAARASAYAVEAPGEALLRFEYAYGSSTPQKVLAIAGTTTDEFLRVGEKLTVELPGYIVGSQVGIVFDPADLPKTNTRLVVTWLHGDALLARETVPLKEWVQEGTYVDWPDARFTPFVVPAGATGMRVVLEVTSPDGSVTGRDSFGETTVFGGELPNKHVFFDMDGGTPQKRVIERGAPIAGSEVVIAYADHRADRLVDSTTIDRRVGRVRTYNPRFGSHETDVIGELVHLITVGYDTGSGFHTEQLGKSERSYVRGGTSQETRVHVPESATKLSMFFHIKTYLVAKYPTYGELTSKKYGDNEWILVREAYDNPAGANTNFSFDTEAREPADGKLQRTVVFIRAETQPGQDLFVRGGIDHDASSALRSVECSDDDGTPNYRCAIPIVHRNYKNASTRPWKLGDAFLDWYGRERSQRVSSPVGLADGTAAEWTTNTWPSEWGTEKSVAVDGYGLEPLNNVGAHLWMLDVDMDCSKAFQASDGSRWFEVKSFVTNGPGWEPDVAQNGTPYPSRNHFAKCGQASYFERGSSNATFKTLK